MSFLEKILKKLAHLSAPIYVLLMILRNSCVDE